MGTRLVKFSFFGADGLAGGLNLTDSDFIVKPQEMTTADNILIGQTLARKKRPGQLAYHTGDYTSTASWPASGVPLRGIIQYWRYGSTTGEPIESLFLHRNDEVWSIPSRDEAAVNRTGALSISTTGIPSYQVFEGILYWCSTDTSEGYNKWDGRSVSPGDAVAATPPADGVGKYLSTYNGRMIMAGNPSFPFRLYYSVSLDGDDWTSGNGGGSLDVSYDGDPDGINALFGEFQGKYYFATRTSIYELSGNTPADFVVQKISSGIGCVSHQSVVQTDNDIIFASDRGVHSLRKTITSDQTEISFISREVQKFYTKQLDKSLLPQAKAVWDKQQNLYILSCPESGQSTNSVVMVYNINFGFWTLWQDVDARTLAPLYLNGDQSILVGREDGQISYLNDSTPTDLGEGIAAIFRSGKFFPGKDITSQWTFRNITLFARSDRVGAITVNSKVENLDSTSTVTKSISLGQDGDLLGSTFILGVSTLGLGNFKPIKFSLDQTGYSHQIEVICSGSMSFEFLGYILEAEPRDSYIT